MFMHIVDEFKKYLTKELEKVDSFSERATNIRKIQNHFSDSQLEDCIRTYLYVLGEQDFETYIRLLLMQRQNDLGETDVEGIGYN